MTKKPGKRELTIGALMAIERGLGGLLKQGIDDEQMAAHIQTYYDIAKAAIENETSGKPGPKPETLKITGNWQAAVKKSLTKKKPATGWPK